MTIGSQEYVDDLTAAGVAILEVLIRLVDGSDVVVLAGLEKLQRDRNIGRELGVALFLACVGEERVNRIELIRGFAHAVGEAVAQQPPENARLIVQAMGQGLADGTAAGKATFRPAGAA